MSSQADLRQAIYDELYELGYDRRATGVDLADLKPGLIVIDINRAADVLAQLPTSQPGLFDVATDR